MYRWIQCKLKELECKLNKLISSQSISSTVAIEDEGNQVADNVERINFVGPGVTVTGGNDRTTVTILEGVGTGTSNIDLDIDRELLSFFITDANGNVLTQVPSATPNGLAGAFSSPDKFKLDGIENNATADQTGIEIVQLINSQLGSTIWQQGGSSSSGGNSLPALGSQSIEVSGQNIISAIISTDSGNTLESRVTGLYVPQGTSGSSSDLGTLSGPSSVEITNTGGSNATVNAVTTTSSGVATPQDKIDITDNTNARHNAATGSGAISITSSQVVSLSISPDTDNTLQERTNGLYVPPGSGGGGSSLVRITDSGNLGLFSYSVRRYGNSAISVTNPSSGEYLFVVPANSETIWYNLKGDSSTVNGVGEIIIKVDNSANGFDYEFIVSLDDEGAEQFPNMFSRGHIISETNINNITTITIPNIGGNYPNGFTLKLR
jgi:hypothetical protein